MGPDIAKLVPGPSAFPTQMPDGYTYWRIAEGVKDTIMPPFTTIMDDSDIWDITAYVQGITGSPLNAEPAPPSTPIPGLATPAPTPTPQPEGGG